MTQTFFFKCVSDEEKKLYNIDTNCSSFDFSGLGGPALDPGILFGGPGLSSTSPESRMSNSETQYRAICWLQKTK
jgi:hypothetical protein